MLSIITKCGPIKPGGSNGRPHICALNLFNVADRDEYLAYSRRSAKEVQAHGGRVVALGRFREAVAGEIKPRTVMIVVEWTSKEAFDGYCNDSNIADLHPHREKGAGCGSRELVASIMHHQSA